MKFKLDFVTNSSSESFTIVLTDTIPAAVASGAFTAAWTSAQLAVMGNFQGKAKQQAEAIAKAVAEEASDQTKAVIDGYSESLATLDTEKQKLQDEIDTYKQQWIDQEESADKSDSGYSDLKKQYEDYIKYLENQVQEKDYQKYVIETQRAESQAAIEAQSEWNRQRQVDLIAAKEEAALLKATLAGYGADGYDTKDIEIRLKQLSEREAELTKTLSENNAMIDYTARDRGVIGAGAEFDNIQKQYKAQMAQLEIGKALAEGAKKAELENRMKQLEIELQQAMDSAYRWDMATKAAEGVQFGADVAIDGLALVTGPAGQKIKLAYKAGKNLAEGMGEGMADPQNAGKHLIKGALGAATEVITDRLGDDNKLKAAIVNSLNQGAQDALDASIEGKDAIEAGVLGIGKGAFDSYVDNKLDGLKDKLPIPKGTSVDVGNFSIGKVYNNNPLTKGLMKTIGREQGVDAVKGFIKDKITGKINSVTGLETPEE